MKYSMYLLCGLILSTVVFSQDNSPFGDGNTSDNRNEQEYDFADVHKWIDEVVVIKKNKLNKHIVWSSCFVASYRGLARKVQVVDFSVDEEKYSAALRHPDLNRGVVLMSGKGPLPALYCSLRPLCIRDGRAYFHVIIPLANAKDMYIGFIPSVGKKRYLYNLKEVAQNLPKK